MGPVKVDGRLAAGDGFAAPGVEPEFNADCPLGIEDLYKLPPV